MEDSYYKLLDSINSKIPIYKVVDPIEKVVPTFPLVLVLAAILAIALCWFVLLPLLGGAQTTLKISVVDDSGTPVYMASVKFTVNGAETETKTNFDGIAELPGLRIGDSVDVEAGKEGYLAETATIKIEEGGVQMRSLTLSSEEKAYATKTIRLVDSAGMGIAESFVLSFSCSSPYATPPDDIYLDAGDYGVANVGVPPNCGKLRVTVSGGTGWEGKGPIDVEGGDFRIELSAEERARATISVNVGNTEGKALDGISVELYKYNELAANPNVGPVDSAYTSAGQAFFDVSPGAYVLKTYDYSGVYGEKQSEKITVGADEEYSYDFTLSATIRGDIKVKVSDAASGAAIDGARVTLLYDSDNSELTTLETDETGVVEFHISQDVKYRATAEAEGYALAKSSGLRMGSAVTEIKMQKCTPALCGKLVVKVIDQDAMPVDNATVALYSAATNYLAGYEEKTTDANGTAKFPGVGSGTYWAFAFKETASGRSDAKYFSSRSGEEADLTVTMQIPLGIVRAVVVDNYGRPVPFPTVSIYNAADGKLIGSGIGDENGVYEPETETKADKRIYLEIAKKDGKAKYADYFTVARAVVGNSVTQFNAVMEPEIIGKKAEVRFLGLYSGGKIASVLAAGAEYTAKLQLRLPEEAGYDEAGMHLRTGEQIIMEKDGIYIKSINAPMASVIKAASYDEGAGTGEADYELTAGDAKWANLLWDEPAAGIYEVEAEVKVRETASMGEELTFHYRAWAENSERVYDPEDKLVEGDELYNNTYREVYQVGASTLCDEDFCFSATITDIAEGLTESVSDAYMAGIFREYKMVFTLTNNSATKIHDNANLRIKNADEGLLLEDYTILDAETMPHSGTVDGYEFPRIDVGNLLPSKKISGTIYFRTVKAGAGIMNMKLVSDQTVVFEKNLTVSVAAAKELEVSVSPTSYPSGIENDINIMVKDKATKLEVERAVVRVKDRFGSVIMHSETGKDGYAYLTLPAQKPGTVLRIEVEKPAYNIAQIEVKISAGVIEASPQSIGVALNIKSKTEAEDRFSLHNLTFFPLKITEIKLSGDFKNLIDMQRVKNWLETSYLNLTIDAGERADMGLHTYLSAEAMELKQRESLEGELLVTVGNFGQKWSFSVPVSIAIGLGEEVDDPACLSISRGEWKAATQGNPVRVEFLIQNNCTIGKKPVALRDLGAKINATGNQLGEYTLTIAENETGLRPAYFRTVLGRVKEEQSLSAVLTFTPYGGVNGLSEADVVLRAVNPLDSGNQVLEAKMKTSITSVNMKECISFDRDLLDMRLEDKKAAFAITTKNCGEPVEFELESELDLSIKKFTMQPDGTQQVEVMFTDLYPGQYPIFVYSKLKSQKEEQLMKTLRVRLYEAGCLQLSRYEFEVYDSPDDEYDGYDTAELLNQCYDKRVTVKVAMKDWMAALKEGSNWGLIMLAGGLAGKFAASEKAKETVWGWIKKGAGTVWGWIGGGKDKTPAAGDGGKASDTSLPIDSPPIEGGAPEPEFPVPEEGIEGAPERPALSTPTGLPTLLDLMESGGEYEMPEITGLATGSDNTLGQLAAGALSFLGGTGGGIGGGIQAILSVITGKANPIVSGAAGLIFGTLNAYTQQEDLEFETMQKDLEVGRELKLLVADGNQDVDDKYVTAEWAEGKPNYETSPSDPKLKWEYQEIIFTNIGNLVTSEERPAYKILKVSGERHKYADKTYSKDDFEITNEKSWFGFQGGEEGINRSDFELDEETPDDAGKKFHLQFNAVPPEAAVEEPEGLMNCQSGTRLGVTGESAFTGSRAPLRIKLAWDWGSIAIDECDEGNENYIYCDATQFSISVLKKIIAIRSWLEENGSKLKCPGAAGALAENTSTIGSYDIGISGISAQTAGNDVNVNVTIENTNPAEIETELSISVENQASGEKFECEDTGISKIKVLSRETVSCNFALAGGTYTATAGITPKIDCENCEDKAASNELSVAFSVGEQGIEECEPYSTARLADFIAATGWDVEALQQDVLGNISFRAHLIRDGYNADFQQDFDRYAQTVGFFNAPSPDYKGTQGLGVYFRNPERFVFRPKYGEANPEGYILPGPGVYNVSINITFGSSAWGLFDANGTESAKIEVELDKADVPEPDSPLYYLPFDGPIGEDGGRVGYGTNYRGDIITINSGTESVRTAEIAGSTNIPGGLLEVKHIESFEAMNTAERGTVLALSRGENPALVYSPSYATPVIMKISKSESKDSEAWAFYSVGIGGSAASTGMSMGRWNGIGYNCRDFDDKAVVESFYETMDMHALNTECALIGGEIAATTYGFEFCNIVDFGSLFLRSIFYTPQGRESFMQAEIAKDSMELWWDIKGSKISLKGTGGQDIANVQNVLDLVREGKVCISSTDSRAEFWWNPAEVYADEKFQGYESEAMAACIGAG